MMLALALLLISPFSFAESNKVIVAVIDTGIDSTHPDLKDNLWKSPVSGAYGWDFVTKSANPSDWHGHGTHIAGIIAGSPNSSTGTGGVTRNAVIMAVRYYDQSGSGLANLENTVQALNYAIDNGAQIINYSGGGPQYEEKEFQALKRAQDRGILVVAAAGNSSDNIDLDKFKYFPASYEAKGLKNIITVGGLGMDGKMLDCSNYGRSSVDIAVSGENILSTIPGGRYGKLTGTSQATALLSGVAAELLFRNPKFSPIQLKAEIFKLASFNPKLLVRGGKYLIFQSIQKPVLKTGRIPDFSPFNWKPLSYDIYSKGGTPGR